MTEGQIVSARMRELVIGQNLDPILNHLTILRQGLAEPGRPAGAFLLSGPTGSGKTHAVESLAEVIHGGPKKVLRIDCGEFQLPHEVARIIGAPPGYLGHRETHPLITQAKLASLTSERSSLSLLLFDEIEKADESLFDLLLGVLDKATLTLGDGNKVNFERTLIFFTSNLGQRRMPAHGFIPSRKEGAQRAEAEAFRPEFLNRISERLEFNPLGEAEIEKILEREVETIQARVKMSSMTRISARE